VVGERLKLGEILVSEGLIDDFQLRTALTEQERFGGRLGVTLVKMSFLTEDDLVRTLARRLQLPAVRLEGKRIDPGVLRLVDLDFAHKHGVLPLFKAREGGIEVLYLGMEDPLNLQAIDDLSFRIGMRVAPVLAGPLQLRTAIARYYGRGAHLESGHGIELSETPLTAGDTAPLVVHVRDHDEVRGRGAGPARTAAERSEPPPAERPRDLATRDILRALTRLLIQKDLIRREELLAAVRAVREEGSEA
jgi:type IV pilus assembly protein PilB